MNLEQMTEQFNAAFKAVQDSVPLDRKYRDSDMCAKYAMHIGMLEGLLKIYVPANKREAIMKDFMVVVNNIVKV